MARKKYLLLPGAALAAALLLVQQEHPAEEPPGSAQPSAVWDEPPAGGGEKAEQRERLTVSVSLDEQEYAALSEISRLWSQRHPGWDIQLVNSPPAETGTGQWRRRALLGEAGDIVLLPSSEIIPLAAAGVLLPLDKLMAGSAGFGGSGAFWEPLYWNGYLWGAPSDADPDVLVWKDSKLIEAGLLRPPTAWEEMELAGAGHPGVATVLIGRSDAGAAAAWVAGWKPEAGAEQLPERLKEALSGRGDGGRMQAYSSYEEAEAAMEAGNAFSAIIPWSEYRRWNPGEGYTPDYRLALDTGSLRMRSYGIMATSASPDAAAAWIAGVTETAARKTAADAAFRLLPKQSLYIGDSSGDGGFPADWKPQLFQGKEGRLWLHGADLLAPLWKSYWNAGGGMSPEQLASAWLQAIEKRPSGK